MPNVLIGAGAIRGCDGRFREILTSAGFDCLDPPGDHLLDDAEMREWLPQASALIAGSEVISPSILDAAPHLRVVARVGVGYDAIDVAAASVRKVLVAITPGANHDSVAEHAFALLLSITRRVALKDRALRTGVWDRTVVLPLRGKVLGLIGFGRIGSAMVSRANAFGMPVIACDPFSDVDLFKRLGVERVDLDELIERADVVSLHAPMTPETSRMINAERLTRMRPRAILINTARGGLVDQKALYEALQSGKLDGAGLDVLDPEPPDFNDPLIQLPNVVITAHVAGIDEQALADMAQKAAECVAELYMGRMPIDCIVNRDISSGWTW